MTMQVDTHINYFVSNKKGVKLQNVVVYKNINSNKKKEIQTYFKIKSYFLSRLDKMILDN